MPLALLYPNEYSVGMSSLGFQLVYDLLGAQDDFVCERFFLPEKSAPLRSLESQHPLTEFPLVFISISFEQDYLNLVRMLKYGGIEPLAKKRAEKISSQNPLVICGGVATFMNPEPLASFVDLFVVGEAEPLLVELTHTIAGEMEQRPRSELLLSLMQSHKGLYAPCFYPAQYDEQNKPLPLKPLYNLPPRIEKITVSKCEVAPHSKLFSSEAEFADMHLTELGRGCSRGCRFCAAGFIYRPPRLWDSEAILAGLGARYAEIDKIGLLGMEMSGSDTLSEISSYLKEAGCGLSFSSLRADRLDEKLLELLSASDLKSVAIAPDGSSERLRRVINKGLTTEDLISGAVKLVGAGIFKLKLYLMIGLPTETDSDLDEAIGLIGSIKSAIDVIGKKRGRLTEILVSVNCFAPKPWTPFQYHPFGVSRSLAAGEHVDSKKVVSELKRRQKRLKTGLSALANVQVQFDKPDNVLFQAVLARGDRRLGEVLLDMVHTGKGWKQVMKQHDLRPEEFAVCGYDEKSWLPWYVIDHKIDSAYLWREYKRGLNQKETKACNTEICRRCGVCND